MSEARLGALEAVLKLPGSKALLRALVRRVPDARFESLREASHFAHVDATDRFLDLVLDFLASKRGPTSSNGSTSARRPGLTTSKSW